MITPGEISDELIRKAEAECEYNVGAWDCADPTEIAAAILNAAIEAGLVSPPCWNMRFNGELQRDANGEPTVWPSRGLDSPDGSISYEHWKGQTK